MYSFPQNEKLSQDLITQRHELELQESRMKKMITSMNEEMKRERSKAAERDQQIEELKLANARSQKEIQERERELMNTMKAQKSEMDQRIENINKDIKESGMDRDGYLAHIIHDYDRKMHQLTTERDELLSLNAVLRLQADEQLEDMKRRISVKENMKSTLADGEVERLKKLLADARADAEMWKMQAKEMMKSGAHRSK